MGRKAKPITGIIEQVTKPEPHKGQWRIRYRCNGVPSASYRSSRAEAEELFRDLSVRVTLGSESKRTAITELTPEQMRQAEFAFQIFEDAGLFDRKTDEGAELVRIAAQAYVEAVRAKGPEVTIARAWEQFAAQGKAQGKDWKTLKDYRRLLRGFLESYGEQAVYKTTTKQTYDFVMGFDTSLDRFKSFGYLHAFFNFCTGKNNPQIDTAGKAWIDRNPMNFKKPVLELGEIESFSLEEVRGMLVHAARYEGREKASIGRRRGDETVPRYQALGYLVFRLFSMCRYEEFRRFSELGGADWDNQFIDLKNNRIIFNNKVYLKRSNGEARGRTITINPTFREWIDYCKKKGYSFGFDRTSEQNARKAVKKTDQKNLLRHTAITMHLKCFKNASDTAYLAGTSTAKIDSNYYNQKISEKEAQEFYSLTPKSLGLIA